MSELRLVGLHDDAEHVVLEGSDGQRFRLPIDDALRAAVRRDRPQLEQLRAELTGTVPPREIQARIRAGATADEVAEASGMPVEMVRRYDGPVLAEREFVAAQARATRVGHDAGAPVLGDLVTDRLATRSVAAESISWDAYRSAAGPWTVEVTFDLAGSQRSARWTYETSTRTVRAVDDEARWLSETELADEPIPRRHLSAVRDGGVFDVEVDAALRPLLASVDLPVEPEAPAEPTPQESTQALLDDLTDRRGVRQHVDVEDDDDSEVFEGFGPQHAFDFEHSEGLGPVPAAHPPASRPDQAVDAQVLEMPAAHRERQHPAGTRSAPDAATPAAAPAAAPTPEDETPAPLAARGRARKGRASVPSWDEIVFGAKPE